MKKFNFENKVEPIEIAGKSYTLDSGNVDFLKKAFSMKEKFETQLSAIDTDNLTPEGIDELVEVMKGVINTFLGEKEFEYIFNHEDCNKSINYITKVCVFLTDEIKIQSGK